MIGIIELMVCFLGAGHVENVKQGATARGHSARLVQITDMNVWDMPRGQREI